jgi:hypothetical protein
MKPKVYVTEKGRKYFIIHGKRFYFNPKLSKKEVAKVYKILRKNSGMITKSKKSITNTAGPKDTKALAQAKAIVNTHNPPGTSQEKKRE